MGKEVNDLLTTYRQLFSGNTSFYGVHLYRANKPGEKEEGQSYTEKKEPLGDKQYSDHLNGNKKGLGIAPLREDSTCAFGVIDVDVYDNDDLIISIINNIYKWNLPLLPFRTKSGGLHLYIFFNKNSDMSFPTGAETRRLLTNLSELLSLKQLIGKDPEIFPKQTVFRTGSQGSWLNMPYYNTDNTNQYLFDDKLKQVPFNKAIEVIQNRRASIDDIQRDLDALHFGDGPPCLQRILLNGGPGDSGRNTFLFNVGIYAKEKDHTTFDLFLDEINDSMDDPLDGRELTDTVKKSVIKKDYQYACNEVPLCDNCNKELCATREYGIGKHGGSFLGVSPGELTIHRGKGISYSWEVTKGNETHTIHIDSPRDLRNQDVFIDAVLIHFNYIVSRVKVEKWRKVVNSALEGALEDQPELADENTLHSRLTKMVLEFIVRHQAKNKIDIERGMVFIDDSKGDVLFRSDDLWKFLQDNKKQRNLKDSDYRHVLSEMGISPKTKPTRVGKRLVRVRTVRLTDVENMIGSKLEPLQDIDWEAEAESEDY